VDAELKVRGTGHAGILPAVALPGNAPDGDTRLALTTSYNKLYATQATRPRCPLICRRG
jgi:hypothetical protein